VLALALTLALTSAYESNTFPHQTTIAGVSPTTFGLGIISAGVFAAICAGVWAIFTHVRNAGADREIEVLGMKLEALDAHGEIASASGRQFKVPFVYRAPDPHPL
jgi:hypothetical protein